MMFKKVLVLVFGLLLLVGCGGNASSNEKAAFTKKYTDEFITIGTKAQADLAAVKNADDFDAVLKDIEEKFNKLIDIKGPSDLESKEKAVDEATKAYLDVLKSAKKLQTADITQSEYMANLNSSIEDLRKVYKDYGFSENEILSLCGSETTSK